MSIEEENIMIPLPPLFPEELDIGRIHTDPLGSYTGRAEKGERPVQDADDL